MAENSTPDNRVGQADHQGQSAHIKMVPEVWVEASPNHPDTSGDTIARLSLAVQVAKELGGVPVRYFGHKSALEVDDTVQSRFTHLEALHEPLTESILDIARQERAYPAVWLHSARGPTLQCYQQAVKALGVQTFLSSARIDTKWRLPPMNTMMPENLQKAKEGAPKEWFDSDCIVGLGYAPTNEKSSDSIAKIINMLPDEGTVSLVLTNAPRSSKRGQLKQYDHFIEQINDAVKDNPRIRVFANYFPANEHKDKPNIYLPLLASADAMILVGQSRNMAWEAAVGKGPIHLLDYGSKTLFERDVDRAVKYLGAIGLNEQDQKHFSTRYHFEFLDPARPNPEKITPEEYAYVNFTPLYAKTLADQYWQQVDAAKQQDREV